MKKLATLVLSFLLIGITAKATSEVSEAYTITNYDGKVYIFEEGGVEFSVFANGEFDFAYIGRNNGTQVQVNTPNVNISFNSGRDYEMYVQYDDYGAVIQIEDVPIYYDGYGRITQAGNVDIQYNDRRIVRVGGLRINYDHRGYYAGYTGYINVYNRFYVYRPWHAYYVQPIFSSCIVYDYPYRTHYAPVRYSYSVHRNYYYNRSNVAYKNARRSFHRPGSYVHYKNGRTAVNREYNANRRNTMATDIRRSTATTRRATTANTRNNTTTTRATTPRKSETASSTRRSTANTTKRNNSSVSTQRASTTKNSSTVRNTTRTSGQNNASTTRRSTTKRATTATPKKRSTVTPSSTRKATTARTTSTRSATRNTTARATTTKRSTNSNARSTTTSRRH